MKEVEGKVSSAGFGSDLKKLAPETQNQAVFTEPFGPNRTSQDHLRGQEMMRHQAECRGWIQTCLLQQPVPGAASEEQDRTCRADPMCVGSCHLQPAGLREEC